MTDQLLPEAKPRIRHRSVADETTEIIRRMILLGEIAPGTRVTQDGLSELVGVSTMPVRESLLRLAAEGLIRALPNRSFSVVELSRSDLVDVYWAHSVLSAELTRRACARADDELIERLRSCQHEFDLAYVAGAIERMEALNWQFHRTIYTAAGASRLLLLLRTTLRYTPEGLYSRVESWVDETIRGHERILQAFDERDGDRAAAEASDHVGKAGDLLIESYSAHGHWTQPEG
ncbi:MAG: GntR family transcriptional regulator [Actinomycetia bacterium]|nr:GntR family transcriptional regulator [Actinomycetes bacterium]